MKRTRKLYSQAFKEQVLEDYFASNMSQKECSQKWNLSFSTLHTWLCACKSQEKSVSLHSNSHPTSDKTEGVTIPISGKKDGISSPISAKMGVDSHTTLGKAVGSSNPFLHDSNSLSPKSNYMDAKDQALSDLRAENERLRREAAYHKLRATGYERLLEIVKAEDGIDLLKKDGAKQ